MSPDPADVIHALINIIFPLWKYNEYKNFLTQIQSYPKAKYDHLSILASNTV